MQKEEAAMEFKAKVEIKLLFDSKKKQLPDKINKY